MPGRMVEAYDEGVAGALTDRFGAPPFTVLNTREGIWRQRKAAWQTRIGMASMLGRKEGLISAQGSVYHDLVPSAQGTSVFDPVLAETAYRWYTGPGDHILDPFAGGSVRGIVAARLGRRYTGVDLSQDQIEENLTQAQPPTLRTTDPVPTYCLADSCELLPRMPPDQVDYLFSCPPYHDLEHYSDDPSDLSNMDWDDFALAYDQVIQHAVRCLRPDRFAGWVVGDFRYGKHGYLRPFTASTIASFEAWGATLYDVVALLTPVGTGALRAAQQFNPSRKLVRTHQSLLVFCKGDPRAATARLGELTPLEEIPDLLGHDQLALDV